ncbi:DUF31 family protein [Mycoplasmopsis cynos]|uniref:DUF31 family putative serine protease n=1 Tax=Mycoplasmopsis cynos TaxID=171284 RepID=UPI0024C6E9A9|nr:hypothetical protein [Mycoplasmopsis cynos]WAM11396.1 DUF31 family protein [Mycoplasmopsis cynos]
MILWYKPSRSWRFTTKTTDWGIEVLSKKINILTKLKVNQLDDRYIHKGFQGQKGIKKIFTGDNYLKTKPSDFLADEQKTKYADNEEFIDFAVLEIDFKDLEFQRYLKLKKLLMIMLI